MQRMLYGSQLGATPGSYECLAWPNTPGCKATTTSTAVPGAVTPTAATPITPTGFWSRLNADIPTWLKVLGVAAIALGGYAYLNRKR